MKITSLIVGLLCVILIAGQDLQSKPEVQGTCGGTITGLLEGSIASPGFPLENYPVDLNCTYEIIVPEGYIIAYRSTFLATEARLNGFCFDYVQVFPSGTIVQSNEGRFCADDSIPHDTSVGRKLIVTFFSDDSVTSDGFAISWTALNVSDSEPSFNCNFDGPVALCPGWKQSTDDDFNWSFGRGPTPSEDTGPTADHTTGTLDGRYAFIEASGRALDGTTKQFKTAELLSPPLILTEDAVCLKLWYHNLGDGQLRVFKVYETDRQNIASIDGDTLDEWQQIRITLPPSDESFRIIIKAVRGSTFTSDVAIDDIMLIPNACNEEEHNRYSTESILIGSTSTVQSTPLTTSYETIPRHHLYNKQVINMQDIYIYKGNLSLAVSSSSTTSTTEGDCQDVLASCPSLVSLCNSNMYIQNLCQQTCNGCIQTETPEETQVCSDMITTCSSLSDLCATTPAVRDICQRTCMICNEMSVSPTTSTVTPVTSILSGVTESPDAGCKDLNEERCRRFSSSCNTDIFKVVCPRTCGLCQGVQEILPSRRNAHQIDKSDCHRITGMDIMFLIDGSGSIKVQEFTQVLEFVKQIINSFDLGKDKVGVMQYSHWFSKRPLSDQPYLETSIPIGQYSDKTALRNALDQLHRHGHTSYTAHAIEKAATLDFRASARYDDPCTQKVIFVITDGSSSDSLLLASSADKARDKGIVLFAIGVRGYSLNELQVIANGHEGNNDRVYATGSFLNLPSLTPLIRSDLYRLSEQD